jgi:GntR family transcriptional regulator
MTAPASKLRLRHISRAGGAPLYQQIIDGLKREITEGRLRPGDALPSFRALAEDLLVSLITVKRAYEELEREGIVVRVQGLGTYVSDDGDTRNRRANRDTALAMLRQSIREALHSGMTPEDLRDAIEKELDSK